MNLPARSAVPDLQELCALFPPVDFLAGFEYVAPNEVPQPYHRLLVHEHHMTVTVEAHHNDMVDVRVLDRKQTPDYYARKILLALHGNGKIVQFGLVRIHFRYFTPEVRDAIVAEQTPLGRLLIQHRVLRRIEPTAFLHVLPGKPMRQWFGAEESTYGRLALLYCDGQPAIELLEIVAPEAGS